MQTTAPLATDETKSAREWTFEVHELSEGFSAIVYDEHGQRIADHLDEATARLIASAPDLLADAEQSALTLDEAANLLEGVGLRGCTSIMRQRAAEARALIARAKGESA